MTQTLVPGPLVLGIETSCDETGVGLVRGHELLADSVASSVAEHARFGGVVPEVASRAHLEAMIPTFDRALATAGIRASQIDALAVTAGPGLAGALMVGVAAAKAYAYALGKPLYGVNHLAAHIAVDQVEHGALPVPAVALLVSGGHSSLLLVPDVAREVIPLGATIDDAAGEAYDKVARVLGLPFPGGPPIDKAARDGDAAAIAFPRGKSRDGTLDFSFAGLKTAVARWVEARQAAGEPVPVADVAASFQEAVADVLTRKAVQACRQHGVQDLIIGGGVAANSRLRSLAAQRCEQARHQAAGAPARAVHRQRRHGRRARRGTGLPGRRAVPARPARRLLPARHRGRRPLTGGPRLAPQAPPCPQAPPRPPMAANPQIIVVDPGFVVEPVAWAQRVVATLPVDDPFRINHMRPCPARGAARVAGGRLCLALGSCRSGAAEAPGSRPARRAVAAGDAQQPLGRRGGPVPCAAPSPEMSGGASRHHA